MSGPATSVVAPPPASMSAASVSSPPRTSNMPSTEQQPASPLHVLMSPKSVEQTRLMLLGDPHIQNDYLTRRYKAWYSSADTAAHSQHKMDLWSAVTKVERAMVECCELGEDSADLAEDEDEELLYQGGALVPGMETTFVGLLARHGQAPVTRALALAILQHTIEQDEIDDQEEREEREKQSAVLGSSSNQQGDGAAGETGVSSSTVVKQDETSEKSNIEATSSQATKNEDDAAIGATDGQEKKESARVCRMSRFFKAGGMHILKQWLVDCSSPTKKVFTSQSSAGTKKTVTKTLPSPTGPLLLPLLSVLEGMPLDKTLVTKTKMNKQIRNYKKLLDEAVEQRILEKGEKLLHQWKDPIAGGLAVVDVQDAIESLMEKWQERIRTSTLQVGHPFVSLQATMKKRLETLVQFDSGKAHKPEWLESLEESERVAKEKKALSKMSTRQLEARQRQQERSEVIQAMQHKQQEIKEKMAQMLEMKRQESLKRKVEQEQVQHKKKAKGVTWKDGFDNSDTLKKRRLLESVFRYPAESSGRWDDESSADEQDEGADEETNESNDAFDMFGDDDDDEVVVVDNQPAET